MEKIKKKGGGKKKGKEQGRSEGKETRTSMLINLSSSIVSTCLVSSHNISSSALKS